MNAAPARPSVRIVNALFVVAFFFLALRFNFGGAGALATRVIAAGAETVGFVYLRRWLDTRLPQ